MSFVNKMPAAVIEAVESGDEKQLTEKMRHFAASSGLVGGAEAELAVRAVVGAGAGGMADVGCRSADAPKATAKTATAATAPGSGPWKKLSTRPRILLLLPPREYREGRSQSKFSS